MKHLYFLLCALFIFTVNTASAKTFETTCGENKFKVELIKNSSHPLDNVYKLYAITSTEEKLLYVGDVGGWFHAACLKDKTGQDIILFQSFCGGSGCVEDKYGIIQAKTLKLILKPSEKNIGNTKRASQILGYEVPYLLKFKNTFCCE